MKFTKSIMYIMISIIYSASQPIDQPVVIKKRGYCIAHPQSDIKLSMNSLENKCIIKQNSTVFYRETTRKTMKDMEVEFEKYSNLIYFIPKNNTLDLSIYNNLHIQSSDSSELLEIINTSQPCNVTVENIDEVILKNRPFNNNNNNNNYLKIACDPQNKQCIIKCIASSSIACQNPITKQQHTIPSGGSFRCILDENNLFWPFDENSSYSLKNFTQVQSNSSYVKLKLVSNQMHASGIYISTCFKNPIKVPSILGKVYQLSTPLKNEIQIIYNKNAKEAPSSQWKYEIGISVPFQTKFEIYDIMYKLQKCLSNAIQKLNTLEMICEDFLVNYKHSNEVTKLQKLLLYLNNISIIDIKMSEIDKNTKNISRLLRVTIYVMNKYKSYLCDYPVHKSLMDQSIESLKELLEKITEKYFPIASAFKTGCRRKIISCIEKDLKKCGIDIIEKEEEEKKKKEEEEKKKKEEEKRKKEEEEKKKKEEEKKEEEEEKKEEEEEEEEEKRKKEEKEKRKKEEEEKKKEFFRYYIISGCCIIIGLFIFVVVYLLKKKNNAHSTNNIDLIIN
ncbi:serine/threonine protein kinase [Enterocytozoon bieneusi H348]|nr:serine/threonine protein kinase [Enterocytozoon bieneusi H348]|eukprot:XP_002650140.1 serine/threonine protein kinase [Enterocytozoon bieneusi H348]